MAACSPLLGYSMLVVFLRWVEESGMLVVFLHWVEVSGMLQLGRKNHLLGTGQRWGDLVSVNSRLGRLSTR